MAGDGAVMEELSLSLSVQRLELSMPHPPPWPGSAQHSFDGAGIIPTWPDLFWAGSDLLRTHNGADLDMACDLPAPFYPL